MARFVAFPRFSLSSRRSHHLSMAFWGPADSLAPASYSALARVAAAARYYRFEIHRCRLLVHHVQFWLRAAIWAQRPPGSDLIHVCTLSLAHRQLLSFPALTYSMHLLVACEGICLAHQFTGINSRPHFHPTHHRSQPRALSSSFSRIRANRASLSQSMSLFEREIPMILLPRSLPWFEPTPTWDCEGECSWLLPACLSREFTLFGSSRTANWQPRAPQGGLKSSRSRWSTSTSCLLTMLSSYDSSNSSSLTRNTPQAATPQLSTLFALRTGILAHLASFLLKSNRQTANPSLLAPLWCVSVQSLRL